MKSYTHFTLFERECLSKFLEEGKKFREIARILGRNVSSISREVARNKSKYSKSTGKPGYHPWRATALYLHRRKRCVRHQKLVQDSEMKAYIVTGLNRYWSPEIIANKCKEIGFSISTSTIYAGVKRGLLSGITEHSHLRRRGILKYKRGQKSNAVHPTRTIHHRPAIVERKQRFGDLEGDTVYGAVGKGCVVTFVDRVSRMLYAAISPSRNTKNINAAIVKALNGVDCPKIHTITLDNGSEFAAFEELEQQLQTEIYFADPHSPWQRGLNENTNGILRFFFPKGTDFLQVSDEELQAVVDLINNRPRKCLDFLSPLDFLSKKCCT